MFFNNINKINELKEEISRLQKENKLLEDKYSNLIELRDGYIEMEDIGYKYKESTKPLCKLEKELINEEKHLARVLANDNYIVVSSKYTINDSFVKGEQMQTNYGKNLLIGFSSYCNSKEKAVTTRNYLKTVELIDKSFNKFNKQGAVIGIELSPSLLNVRKTLLKIKLDIKVAKSRERECIKEEKHRLKEQEKLMQEIEHTKKELDKERKQYEQMLSHSITPEEQESIKSKLQEIDKREADADYRLQNAKAGWLYVIESKALPNMVKIGCTRRLNPFVRIAELSTAGVPFPFECRGLVFSEDVFALENSMHRYFDDKRVNNENKRKEFFKISPQEAIDVLTNKFKCEVQFAEEKDFDKNINTEES